ncbi:alkaline phosphatase, partial [Sarracenia purpurea var. burkii]
MDNKVSDVDNMPYSTLLYGNGPGFSVPRMIPTNLSVEEKNAVHGAAVPRKWATHGGEDVPVYAAGPLASMLFTGTVDQSYIPHAIAYIACFAEHRKRCSMSNDIPNSSQTSP